MQQLLLGGLLLLAIVWLIARFRRDKGATESEAQLKTENSGAFHAIAIKYSEDACDAAKAMTGRRFLSSAAPRLPLPECDRLECRCTFAHYDDRRKKQDRRSPFARSGGTGTTGAFEAERREKSERRHDDDDTNW